MAAPRLLDSDDDPRHVSVLSREVIEALAPRDGGVYVDGTFGAGGYSRGILRAADCRVVGIDRDPSAIRDGEALRAEYDDRLSLLEGCFGAMETLLRDRLGITAVDGITLDLGVSSMQLDQAERGFAFSQDGPLDMRMDAPLGEEATPPRERGAARLVNSLPETELADIIWRLGEEKASRRVARAIVAARADGAILRTGHLAEIVRAALPRPPRKKSGGRAIDPATKTFQALRIAVNDELGQLRAALVAAARLLKPGGRLAIVSFHSLEDRIVKQFLVEHGGRAPRGHRHGPEAMLAEAAHAPPLRLIAPGGIKPGDAETNANPRARSARLRIAERTDAPFHPSSGNAS